MNACSQGQGQGMPDCVWRSADCRAPAPDIEAIIAEAKKLRCPADSPVHGHICICPGEQMCQDAHAYNSCLARCESFAALLAAASRAATPPVVGGETERIVKHNLSV